MAVQRSTSNLFLLTPRVFTVEYIYNAQGDKCWSANTSIFECIQTNGNDQS